MKLKDYYRPNVKAKTQNYHESLISSGNHTEKDSSWADILENNIKNLEICASTITWHVINESTDEISFEYIISRTFTDIHTCLCPVHGRCLCTQSSSVPPKSCPLWSYNTAQTTFYSDSTVKYPCELVRSKILSRENPIRRI